MRCSEIALLLALSSGIGTAKNLSCNMFDYKPVNGVSAAVKGYVATITRPGESDERLMTEFTNLWRPAEGVRAGNFFGPTGKTLFHQGEIEGTGAKRTYTATVEYTQGRNG